MIRQAHTYLAGAVSGTALIAAAVVAFVVLVSFQALRDWPLAGIGGGGDSPAVSEGQPVSPGSAAATATGPTGAATAATAKDDGAPAGNRSSAGVAGDRTGGDLTVGASPAPQAGPAPAGSPTPQAPGASPGGGGNGASPSSSPNATGGDGGGGGGGLLPGTGGSGGGSGSTSGTVTGTVNETVSGVDKALGGTLDEAGVTKVTEEAVNGVAGPESTVGKTVDKVGETVGGLLGGNR
jgi:hypothetical protein